LLAITLTDTAQTPLAAIRLGEEIVCRVWYRAEADRPVHVTMVTKNRYDQVVNSCGSYTLGIDMPITLTGEIQVFELCCRMNLEAGQYGLMFSLGCVDERLNQGSTMAETPWVGPLTVLWDYASQTPPFYGMFGLPVTARLLHGVANGRGENA
jgi:lipopolysaccharide transport system ATP-binding protein